MIPEHNCPAAVFAFGNRALEGVVIDRMIFDLHRKSFHGGIETRAFGHGPTLHDSVELETEIEVKMRGCVFLDNETQPAGARGRGDFLSRWLTRSREVAFLPILSELGASPRPDGAAPSSRQDPGRVFPAHATARFADKPHIVDYRTVHRRATPLADPAISDALSGAR